MFAYIGPDTIIPLGSALAAIVGGFLIGWRWFTGLFFKVARLIVKKQ